MIAEVALIEGKELKPGECAYAQLRLAEPGLFLPGDRFIIRQFSPVVTIGGGTVLDNFPVRHRMGDPAVREFLKALEESEPETRLELLLRALGEESVPTLVARTGWPAAEVLRLAAILTGKKQVLILGQPPAQLLHMSALEELSEDVLQALTRFHAAQPLVQGMAREELRGQARLGRHEVSPLAFNAALEALIKAGKIKDETVFLAGRGIQLNTEEQAAKEQISQAFEKAGLEAPSAEEVLASLRIDRARAQKILQILLKEKVLHKVTEGLIFHHSALEALREKLRLQKNRSERINVSAFKELTGVSRKYAIPLLEYLDRERVTRRVGDERIIL